MDTEMKVTLVCSKCKVEKSTENFNKRKASRSGFHSKCKACRKVISKIYYQHNKEELAAKKKIYNQNNKEELVARRKIYYQNNKEELVAKVNIYYQNNKEEIVAKKKIYNQNNKEEIAAKKKIYNKLYRQKHKEDIAAYRQNNKERLAKLDKLYAQNNRHKVRAKNSKRRASKINATPTWTSKLQKLQIEALHKEAVNLERLTGVKFHLDHIHPLNPPKRHYFEGEWIGEICGLELPCNFQLLTESENCSKSNKFECYTESELDPNNLKPWQCFYPVLSIENLESA